MKNLTLEDFKYYLRKYNNKKMPPEIQKQIRAYWNVLRLWEYVDYSGVPLKRK